MLYDEWYLKYYEYYMLYCICFDLVIVYGFCWVIMVIFLGLSDVIDDIFNSLEKVDYFVIFI